MDLTPLVSPSLKLVQSYGAGMFRVRGEVYSSPVLLCGEVIEAWNVSSFRDINDQIKRLSGQVDVLLIGAGGSFVPFTPLERAEYSKLGFTVDVMDTGAACRTYNILAAEGRRVAAALIPV